MSKPHTGEAPSRMPIEALLFLLLAVFATAIGLVYAVATAASDEGFEAAGTLVLGGLAVFAATFGLFLLGSVRQIQHDREVLEEAHVAGEREADEVLYLPATSIWPVGLAVGLSLVLAGIPLGLWVLIPGLALLVYSVIGFAHQTRTRS